MLFAVYAIDNEDSLQLRMSTRESHLAYLSNFPLVFAGPLLDEQGNMCGSLIVLDMQDISEVKEFTKNDPYAIVGLFKSVEIRRFIKAFPRDEINKV